MKKQENKKFGFEKFQLVKLNNLRKIVGGDTGDVIDTGTNTGNNSSQRCQNPNGGNGPRNQNPKPVVVPKKD